MSFVQNVKSLRSNVVSSWRNSVLGASPADLRPSPEGVAALVQGRRDLTPVAALFDAQRGEYGPVLIRFGDAAQRFDEIVWRVSNTGAHAFEFSPHLFSDPLSTAVVSRFVGSAPTLLAIASDLGRSGETSIAFGDEGAGRGLAFCDKRPDALLLPDPMFIRSRGHADAVAHFAASWGRFRQRSLTAWWRGASSGWFGVDGRRVESFLDLPRVKLCLLAHRRGSGAVDARITEVVGLSPSEGRSLVEHDPPIYGPPESWKRCGAHAIQIDIDGNSNAWEGLFIRLATGTPVLKVRSQAGYRQWYYDRLEPWTNMIPVEEDLSDLVDKIAWLKRNPGAIGEIGSAGVGLVRGLDFAGEIERCKATVSRAFDLGL